MTTKYATTIITAAFILVSCAEKQKFPAPLSEKFLDKNVVLAQPIFENESFVATDSILNRGFSQKLNELQTMIRFYGERNEKFDLAILENEWMELKPHIEKEKLPGTDLKTWIEITGFIIGLTGKAEYAEELERTVFSIKHNNWSVDVDEFGKAILPYIFTKNVDHIFLNLFVNAAIKYEHSTFGKINIEQETEYPKTGKVLIKIGMEERKYVELNIRIPSWAEGATVTVKKVKYVANPGSYCKIAKKWNDGDMVEIEFPSSQKPNYLP